MANRTMLISEMNKFNFGSRVFCSDGEDGVLTHIGFDAASRGMTSVAVRQGRLFGKTFYLPANKITKASSDGINLAMTLEELGSASKSSLGDVVLDSKSVVERDGGPGRGILELVALHPQSNELTYIVVHNLRPNQSSLLQAQYVTKIENGRITVSIPDAILQTLAPYRADSELQQEVEAVLFDLTPLHVDFRGMTVRVLDSVLYIDGNISSSLRSDIVTDQASGVPGLLEIKNRLVGDDQLAADLAMALGRDERTRDLPIGVYPKLGVARLSGAVHNQGQRAAAEEIARQFPGVRSVNNELTIDPKAEVLTVMTAPEGSEVTDKVPGKYIRHTK